MQLAQLPGHLQLWLAWLAIVSFLGPLALIRHRLARVVLLFQLANAALGAVLGLSLGLVRLLGLSHVIFWTPMLIVVARAIPSLTRNSALGIWARVFALTILLSLVLDYIDVARYILGERGPLVPHSGR
ncbi:MAG: hypothetical protein HY056_11010 [Proteobacteria bacterium]|nr:hypothetical protein [Pseudomonadota bacterium]